MADMDASINLTLNDNASAQIASLVQQFANLSGNAMPAAKAGMAEVEGASEGAGEGLRHTAESGNVLSEALEQLGTHTRTVSMGLGAMGLGAQEATEKVLGLTEALVAMSSAVPGMLAVAGALTVIAGGVNFMVDAVKDASAMQSYMATLGAAVEAQGGNWEENKEQVEQWLTTVSEASGVLRADLVPALNMLVTAGNSVHDSEVIEQAAIDLSIAKHMSLRDATNMLIQAEDGHDTRLVRLVGSVQKVVDAHGNYQQVLNAVVKATQDSVTENDSLEMAHNRLKVQIEAVSEALGDLLIPFLTQMEYELIGAIKNAELFGDIFTTVFHAVTADIEAGTKALGMFGQAMELVLKGNLAGASQSFESGANAFTSGTKSGNDAAAAAFQKWANAPEAGDQGRQSTAKAVSQFEQLNSQLDNPNGFAKATPQKGTAYDPSDAMDAEKPTDVDALTKAHQALAAAEQDQTNAQLALNASVDASLDSAQADIKTQDDAFLGYVKNLAAINSLKSAITENQQAVEEDRNSYNLVNAAYQEATQKLEALQASLKGHTQLTQADKEAVKDAENAQKEAADALDTVDKTLKDSTNTLLQHEAQLGKDTDAVNKYIDAQQKLASSLLDTQEKDNAKLQNDIATHGKSEDETLAYYTKLYQIARDAEQQDYAAHGSYDASLVQQANNAYSQMIDSEIEHYNKDYDTVKAALDKITKLQQDALNTQIQDEQKAQQQAENDIDTALNAVLTKTNNFAEAWKSLWKTITENYIKQWEQMLFPTNGTGTNSTLGGISSLFGISSSPTNSQQSQSQVQLTNATQALVKAQTQLNTDFPNLTNNVQSNTSALNQANSNVPALNTTMQTNTQGLTNNTAALTQLTQAIKSGQSSGSGSGSDSNSQGATGTPINLAGVGGQPVSAASPLAAAATNSSSNSTGPIVAGSGGSDYTPLAGFTGANPNTNNGGSPVNLSSIAGLPISASSALGKAASGAAIGTTIANLDGGDSTNASILGAIGGLFGPVGSVAGGVLGSLIGPHWGPATNYPDRSDTENYGTNLANWQGSNDNEVNGTEFNAEQQYNTTDGNLSLAQQLEQWQAQNANNVSNLTQAQQAMYQQISQLDNGNPSANLNITAEHNGVFYFADGQQMSVTDIENLESQYQAIGSSGALPTGPSYTVTRMGPNYNASNISGWSGSSADSTVTQTGNQIVVNINAPNIYGSNGINQFAQQISNLITLNNTTGAQASNNLVY
jgi:hypothetical protein